MPKDKLKDIYNYKPSNPDDPKIPKFDKNNYFQYDKSFDESQYHFESSIGKIEKNDESNKKEELLVEGFEQDKSQATSIISKIKKMNEMTDTLETIERSAEELITNEFVIPDPTSELNIFNAFANRKYRALEEFSRTKDIIKNSRGEVRANLTEKEIKKILDTFKFKVVKTTQKEVVIKNNKYGFEIYKNSYDNRYWVAASCFEEIWDPKKNNYVNLWVGNSFTGYGFNDFEETLNQTMTMMTKGKTGQIMWRDYVTGWSKQKNRFYAGSVPEKFTFLEYKKIVKWYRENKIWILVKQAKVKDIEDLMEENKEKRKRGESISAMSMIQAKLLEPPRRAQLIFGYPVENPNYKGKDYVNPENKLYEIGFAFTE
ncbi:hypothetical protein [Spiroplasma diminutum]|uniref:Uncharacterized protein n=1 Tax=Spiroplasma diminutum CUAS-1 TaxID=1276221 RepID=S5LX15_9MOLU|nr:hypothetical protein [Spiroplasma diminutum]AGR42349.1 hypothetical protein SDIMI_v3c06450 [Spiroplasma diminutum CUAS-1]